MKYGLLSHPKYTKPMKGNKTDRKDSKRICDLYMCNMVSPSFIPSADIKKLRDLVRYRYKLTCMITAGKNRGAVTRKPSYNSSYDPDRYLAYTFNSSL